MEDLILFFHPISTFWILVSFGSAALILVYLFQIFDKW